MLDKRFKGDDLAMKKKAWNTSVNLKHQNEQDSEPFVDRFEKSCSNRQKQGETLMKRYDVIDISSFVFET